MERFENNIVTIAGEIVKDFEFSNEVYGEGFYSTEVAVTRTSQFVDYVPILVSERLVDVKEDWKGQFVLVNGEFRSHNKEDEGKRKLLLSIFAKEFECQDPPYENCNSIVLHGHICKQPSYRKTPLGREIADMIVAVNRGYGKSDYIPCICWGRNARYVSCMDVGSEITLEGRVQSRDYIKRFEDGTDELRTAYEVSVAKIEM